MPIFRWMDTKLRSFLYFCGGMLIGGVLIWLFATGGLGGMIGPYFIAIEGFPIYFLMPYLEVLGQTFFDGLSAIFDPTAELFGGYIIFIVIAAAIIVAFTILAVKFPEEPAEEDE